MAARDDAESARGGVGAAPASAAAAALSGGAATRRRSGRGEAAGRLGNDCRRDLGALLVPRWLRGRRTALLAAGLLLGAVAIAALVATVAYNATHIGSRLSWIQKYLKDHKNFSEAGLDGLELYSLPAIAPPSSEPSRTERDTTSVPLILDILNKIDTDDFQEKKKKIRLHASASTSNVKGKDIPLTSKALRILSSSSVSLPHFVDPMADVPHASQSEYKSNINAINSDEPRDVPSFPGLRPPESFSDVRLSDPSPLWLDTLNDVDAAVEAPSPVGRWLARARRGAAARPADAANEIEGVRARPPSREEAAACPEAEAIRALFRRLKAMVDAAAAAAEREHSTAAPSTHELEHALAGASAEARGLRRVARAAEARPACRDVVDEIHEQISNIKYQIIQLTEMLERIGLRPQMVTYEMDQSVTTDTAVTSSIGTTQPQVPRFAASPIPAPFVSQDHSVKQADPSEEDFQTTGDAQVSQEVEILNGSISDDTNAFVGVASREVLPNDDPPAAVRSSSSAARVPADAPLRRAQEEETIEDAALPDTTPQNVTPDLSPAEVSTTEKSRLTEMLHRIEEAFKSSVDFCNSSNAQISTAVIDKLLHIDKKILQDNSGEKPTQRFRENDSDAKKSTANAGWSIIEMVNGIPVRQGSPLGLTNSALADGAPLRSSPGAPRPPPAAAAPAAPPAAPPPAPLTLDHGARIMHGVPVPAPTFVPYPVSAFGLQTLKTQQQLVFSPQVPWAPFWGTPVCFPAGPAAPSAPASGPAFAPLLSVGDIYFPRHDGFDASPPDPSHVISPTLPPPEATHAAAVDAAGPAHAVGSSPHHPPNFESSQFYDTPHAPVPVASQAYHPSHLSAALAPPAFLQNNVPTSLSLHASHPSQTLTPVSSQFLDSAHRPANGLSQAFVSAQPPPQPPDRGYGPPQVGPWPPPNARPLAPHWSSPARVSAAGSADSSSTKGLQPPFVAAPLHAQPSDSRLVQQFYYYANAPSPLHPAAAAWQMPWPHPSGPAWMPAPFAPQFVQQRPGYFCTFLPPPTFHFPMIDMRYAHGPSFVSARDGHGPVSCEDVAARLTAPEQPPDPLPLAPPPAPPAETKAEPTAESTTASPVQPGAPAHALATGEDARGSMDAKERAMPAVAADADLTTPSPVSAILFPRGAVQAAPANKPAAHGNKTAGVRNAFTHCLAGERACADGTGCLAEALWCDDAVHCPDASDEADCSCRLRVRRDRLCDGFFDCPRGADEEGCGGCPPGTMACGAAVQQATCVPVLQRCDGIAHCPDERDEIECSTLAETVGSLPDFPVSLGDGVLHRNWRGVWYPVCGDVSIWANDVCTTEIWPLITDMASERVPVAGYVGPWLLRDPHGVTAVVTECHGGAMRVTCPAPPCGTRIQTPSHVALHVGHVRQGETGDGRAGEAQADAGGRATRRAAAADSAPAGAGGGSSSPAAIAASAVAPRTERESETTTRLLGLALLEGTSSLPTPEKESLAAERLAREEEEEAAAAGKRKESPARGRAPTTEAAEEDATEEAAPPSSEAQGEAEGAPKTDGPEARGERIVGGAPSMPARWPWVVAIYRDGVFHCGGAILSADWIMTAAHCVDKVPSHYYEVRAGILRRSSFSPQEQLRHVLHVAAHEAYDRADMRHDLALMRLAAPLHLNRWVRPVCLPTPSARRPSEDPGPGTLCTVVGWGAVRERGPDPDHQQEVVLPVLARCKHAEDRAGGLLCAGVPEGGRDACQGDSGGPLLCQRADDRSRWFAAGIVSHGEGCARPDEPGAYTRVRMYLDWIVQHTDVSRVPTARPRQRCPGFQCPGGRCLPARYRCDRFPDCLHAEDERRCPFSIHGLPVAASLLRTRDGQDGAAAAGGRAQEKGLITNDGTLVAKAAASASDDSPKAEGRSAAVSAVISSETGITSPASVSSVSVAVVSSPLDGTSPAVVGSDERSSDAAFVTGFVASSRGLVVTSTPVSAHSSFMPVSSTSAAPLVSSVTDEFNDDMPFYDYDSNSFFGRKQPYILSNHHMEGDKDTGKFSKPKYILSQSPVQSKNSHINTSKIQTNVEAAAQSHYTSSTPSKTEKQIIGKLRHEEEGHVADNQNETLLTSAVTVPVESTYTADSVNYENMNNYGSILDETKTLNYYGTKQDAYVTHPKDFSVSPTYSADENYSPTGNSEEAHSVDVTAKIESVTASMEEEIYSHISSSPEYTNTYTASESPVTSFVANETGSTPDEDLTDAVNIDFSNIEEPADAKNVEITPTEVSTSRDHSQTETEAIEEQVSSTPSDSVQFPNNEDLPSAIGMPSAPAAENDTGPILWPSDDPSVELVTSSPKILQQHYQNIEKLIISESLFSVNEADEISTLHPLDTATGSIPPSDLPTAPSGASFESTSDATEEVTLHTQDVQDDGPHSVFSQATEDGPVQIVTPPSAAQPDATEASAAGGQALTDAFPPAVSASPPGAGGDGGAGSSGDSGWSAGAAPATEHSPSVAGASSEAAPATPPTASDGSASPPTPSAPQPAPAPPTPLVEFRCSQIRQRVPLLQRCDGRADCLDGSDEQDCVCAERLLATAPGALCDAHADCADLSDENDCGFCRPGEFHCAHSRRCVEAERVCDHHVDCEHKEDEAECFALATKELAIPLDDEGRPHGAAAGLLAYRASGAAAEAATTTAAAAGAWWPLCAGGARSPLALAVDACAYLGFSGYDSFGEMSVRNMQLSLLPLASNSTSYVWSDETTLTTTDADVPLMEETADPTTLASVLAAAAHSSRRLNRAAGRSGPSKCTGLWVQCSGRPAGAPAAFRVSRLGEVGATPEADGARPEDEADAFAWPWEAAVHVEGAFRCGAALLEESWLLASIDCLSGLHLDVHLVAAALGVRRPRAAPPAPGERVERVDALRVVGDAALLLHLQAPVAPGRRVRPLRLPRWPHLLEPEELEASAGGEECVAPGRGPAGDARSVFLTPAGPTAASVCPAAHKCFHLADAAAACRATGGRPWSGVVACRSPLGWVPAAVFSVPDGFCAATSDATLAFPAVAALADAVQQAMAVPEPPAPAPACATVRCPLGRCLAPQRVCDGVADCRDASDEAPPLCARWRAACASATRPSACACAPAEMRCAGGQCVPKAAFCDGARDCADGSDEPPHCGCASFLRLAAPSLLCDGRRNCFDKADEAACPCAPGSFSCARSGTCVSTEVVCDGDYDCPNKEDEENCVALSTGDDSTTGEVKVRSYGSWHSYCPSEVKEEQFSRLCVSLGYSKMENYTLVKHLPGSKEVMLPDLQPFTTAKLNQKTEMILRGDRPLVNLQFLRKEPCNVLFLTCK